MPDAPLPLTDDDFDHDAPPGYLSQQDKDRYIPRMATLLGVTFVLQIVLPMALGMIMMPAMMFGKMATAHLPQYTKMTAWQDALWYPTLDSPGGGGGSKLTALDYAGETLDKPAIALDAQPDWLIADGERLWAVSRNDVTEVFADGSRPVTMHPARYLHHAAKPFLHEGQLAVIDWDETRVVQLCVFDNGEWKAISELAIPDFTTPLDAESVDGAPPADALAPQNTELSDAEAELQARKLAQTLNMPGQLRAAEDVIRAVVAADAMHVVLEQAGRLYHYRGLPVNDGGARAENGWKQIEISNPTDWTLTTIAGTPAILVQAGQPQTLELWGLAGDGWRKLGDADTFSDNHRSELGAFTTPDGSRTLAAVENMGGLSQDLLELKPDGVERVRELHNLMPFNPMSADYMWFQIAAQTPAQLLTLIMVLGSTWLMNKHRDPNYYRGRIPVAYASILRRGLAVLVDGAIISGPLYAGWVYWYLHSDMTFSKFMRMMESNPRSVFDYFLTLVPGLIATAGWLIGWAFIDWMLLSFFGCTIGKYVCGVRVARTSLQRPGLLRGLARMIMAVIESTFGLVLPIALIAFLQNRQRLADLVAGTVVVKAGSLRQARAALALQTATIERP